ncbi:MAG: sulfur carrier protein ThiS [Candidatus Acidiferrales bacterium]
MRVIINGEEREVSQGATVTALLAELHLPAERVAIERNRDILPRAQWATTHVEAGDSYEVVQLVGGG